MAFFGSFTATPGFDESFENDDSKTFRMRGYTRVTPEEEALRLLSCGLIDIRATAWGEVVGDDPKAQSARVAMIADALHNLPSAVRVGTAEGALARASSESASGQWLASERARLPRRGHGA